MFSVCIMTQSVSCRFLQNVCLWVKVLTDGVKPYGLCLTWEPLLSNPAVCFKGGILVAASGHGGFLLWPLVVILCSLQSVLGGQQCKHRLTESVCAKRVDLSTYSIIKHCHYEIPQVHILAYGVSVVKTCKEMCVCQDELCPQLPFPLGLIRSHIRNVEEERAAESCWPSPHILSMCLSLGFTMERMNAGQSLTRRTQSPETSRDPWGLTLSVCPLAAPNKRADLSHGSQPPIGDKRGFGEGSSVCIPLPYCSGEKNGLERKVRHHWV